MPTITTLIDQLSETQRKAFVRTEKFIARGHSIVEATKRANVKTSDYNNARNRLRQLTGQNTKSKSETKRETIIRGSDDVTVIKTSDFKRLTEILKRAVTTLTERTMKIGKTK